MSVRKSSVKSPPRPQSGGVTVLKNLALVSFLLLASFVIGFLIISPMLNLVAGPRNEASAGPSAQPNGNPSPPPSANPGIAPRNDTEQSRPRRNLEVEPGLELTPDRSEPRSDVQPPNSVEDGQATTTPNESDLRREDAPRSRRDEGTGQNHERRNSEEVQPTDRVEGGVHTGRTEETNRSERSRRTNRDGTDRREERTSQERTPPRRNSPPKRDDIQKSDPIDR